MAEASANSITESRDGGLTHRWEEAGKEQDGDI